MAVGGPTYAVTEAVTNIGATTATAGGVAYPGDGATITGRGVVMGTSPKSNQTPYPDYFQNQFPAASAGPGQFTVPLTGLTPGQTYYLCAYAVDDSQTGSGIYYGGEVAFTVPAAHTSARSDTQAVADQIRKSPTKRPVDATTSSDTVRKTARKRPSDTVAQAETVRRTTRKRASNDEATTADQARLKASNRVADAVSAAIDYRENLARNPRLLSTDNLTPRGGSNYSPGGVGSRSNDNGVQTINVFSHTGGNSRYGVLLQGTYSTGAVDPPYTKYSISIDLDELILDGASRFELYVELMNGNSAQTQYRTYDLGTETGRQYATFTAGAFTVTSFNVYVFFVLPTGWVGNAKAVVKNLMVERGDTRGPYFDGSTPGASWSGEADYSRSTLPITVKTVGKRLNDVSPAQEGIRLGMTRLVADAVTQSDSMAKRQGHGQRPQDVALILDGFLQSDTPIITNLMPNPSIENGTTNDLGGNFVASTQTIPADGGAVGSRYLRRTITTAQTGANSQGYYKNVRISMNPGDKIAVSYYVRTSKATQFKVNLEQAGAFTQGGAVHEIPANVWTRVSQVFTVSPNTIDVRPAFYSQTGVWNVGDVIDFDGFMVTLTDKVYDYGDGDSYAWSWDGAVNNSTSSGPINAGQLALPATNVTTRKTDVANAQETRNNLLLNPSFESSNMVGIGSYWSGQVSFDASEKKRGSQSLKVSSPNTTQPNGMIHFVNAGVWMPAGTLIYTRVSVKAPLGLELRLSNRASTTVNLEETVSINFVGTGEWETYTLPPWTYNGSQNGGLFRPGYQVRNPQASADPWTFWVDEAILSTSPIVDYIDGDTPGATWDGTPHQSASRINGLVKKTATPKSDVIVLGDGLDAINMVPNPGFEIQAPAGPNTFPVPDWRNTGSSDGVSIDPTGGRNGDRAVKLVVNSANTYIGVGQVAPQLNSLNIEDGKVYTIQFDHRSDGNAWLEYSFVARIRGTGSILYLTNLGGWVPLEQSLGVQTSADWSMMQRSITPPPNTEAMYFIIIKRAFQSTSINRTFWIDNVKIFEPGLAKNVSTVKSDTYTSADTASSRPGKRVRDIAQTARKYFTFNAQGGITVPHSEELNVGAYDDYTVIFKFRTNSSADHSISEKWEGKPNAANRYPWAIRGPQLNTSVTGAIYDGTVSPGKSSAIGFGGNLSDGKWHTGIFSRVWSLKRLWGYMDGLQTGNNPDTTDGDVSTEKDITIGTQHPTFARWTGDIAEFILLRDIAMTQEMVTEYMATGILPKAPVLHLKLEDDSELPIVRDLSPTQSDGRATAGATQLGEEPSDVQLAKVGKRVSDSAQAIHTATLRNVRRFLTDATPAVDQRRANVRKRPVDSLQAIESLRKFVRTTVAESLSASDEPFNLATNGSFEDPLTSTWSVGTAAERDTKYAMDGSYSLKFTSGGGWSNITRIGNIPITAGQSYTGQVIVTTEEPHVPRPTTEGGSALTWTRLYYYFRRANGSIITEGEFGAVSLGTVRKNYLIAGTKVAPPEAVSLSLHIFQYGLGTAWYDNMALTEGDTIYNMEGGKLVAVSKNVRSNKAEQLAALDTISKLYRKNINNDTLTVADARRIRNVLRKMDTATLTDLLVKKVAKRLADTTNILDNIRKSPRVRKADVATVADAIRKAIALGIFDSIIMSDIGEDELIRKAYTVLRARAGRGNVGQSDTIKARSMR